jgi:hypothetical protein
MICNDVLDHGFSDMDDAGSYDTACDDYDKL